MKRIIKDVDIIKWNLKLCDTKYHLSLSNFSRNIPGDQTIVVMEKVETNAFL